MGRVRSSLPTFTTYSLNSDSFNVGLSDNFSHLSKYGNKTFCTSLITLSSVDWKKQIKVVKINQFPTKPK